MKAIKISENIYWVGAIDYKLRNFHGYSTSRGSTYNAYLIIDEEITLIDTVKKQFFEEMIERINSVCNVKDIKNIIINHAEPDHSGSLPELIKIVPEANVFASGASGVKITTSHYPEVKVLPVGKNLKIGKRVLQFVPTPMVHWPDNMVTYSDYDKILFSNDAFGQHIASVERFDEEFDLSVQMFEARKYYANIVLPYSLQVGKALEIVKNLDTKIIAPSHGLMWKANIKDILDCYNSMSKGDERNRAVIVYDTMWGSTEKMAKAIADGFTNKNIGVRVMDLQTNHVSDIITEIVNAKYICVGSPTLNNNMLPTVAGFLCYLKGLAPIGKHEYIAFGSYGWGGQSVGLIENELNSLKFQAFIPPQKLNYYPNAEGLAQLTKAVEEKL